MNKKIPIKDLLKINNHLSKLWNLSKDFYLNGDYSTATFFAITLIEETGKVGIIYFEKKDTKAFYNHKEKYKYAVAYTLFVNSRVSRIYNNLEKKFAKLYRTGELFKIRNNSLYIGYDDSVIYSPEEIINKETAFTLICIAGEVFAEIQGEFVGADSNDWIDAIKEVDNFRENNKEDFTDFIHLTKEQLSDELVNNIEFIIDDSEWFFFYCFFPHLLSELPDEMKNENWLPIVEEYPFQLIETLRLLAARKTFKGTCPVCEGW